MDPISIANLVFTALSAQYKIGKWLFGAAEQPVVNAQVKGGAVPRNLIIGKRFTAGSIIYAATYGTYNEFLVQVIALSDYPIKEVTGVWVDDELFTGSLPKADPYYTGAGYRVQKGHKLHFFKFYDGNQTQADAYLLRAVGDEWCKTNIGKGISYVIVTTQIGADSRSIPQFKFEVEGARLYDPSKDSSVGGKGPQRWDNKSTWGGDGDDLPAVQIYNILRGFYVDKEFFYGLRGATSKMLDTRNWVKQIEKCRELIKLEDGSYEPMYRSSLEINVCEPVGDVLKQLILSCDGSLAESFGRFNFQIGALANTNIHITDDDLLDSGNLVFSPFSDAIKEIKSILATYPEPKEKWSNKQLDIKIEQAEGESDLNYARKTGTTLEFQAVYSGYQVKRLMRNFINQVKNSLSVQIELPPKFYGLEANDVISWSSDIYNYEAKQFRIVQISQKPDLTTQIRMVETDPKHFAIHAEDKKVLDYTPDVEDTIIKQEIRDFLVFPEVLKDKRGVDVRNGIRIKWDKAVLDVDFVEFEIQDAKSKALLYTSRSNSPEKGEIFTAPNVLQSRTKYNVRARYGKAINNKEFVWTNWEEIETQAIYPISRDLLDKDVRDELDYSKSTLAKQAKDIDDINQAIEDGANQLKQELKQQKTEYTSKIAVVSNETKALSGKLEQTKAQLGEKIAQTTSTLTSKITKTDSNLNVLAKKIDSVNFDLDQVHADGYFRTQATYDKEKAEVRVGLGATLNKHIENENIDLHHSIELVVSENRGNYAILNTDKVIFANGTANAFFKLRPKTDNKEDSFELTTQIGKATNNLSFNDQGLMKFNDIAVSTPIGMISAFAHKKDIGGWLYCDGRKLLKNDYKTLYATIGDTWLDKQKVLTEENKQLISKFLSDIDSYDFLDNVKKYFKLMLQTIEAFKQRNNRNIDPFFTFYINKNVTTMSKTSEAFINDLSGEQDAYIEAPTLFGELVKQYVYWENEYVKVRGSVLYWQDYDGSADKFDKIQKALRKVAIKNLNFKKDFNYFCIPDFRGAFLRGWDDGRGLDAKKDRLLGSYQEDALEDHMHYTDYVRAGDGFASTYYMHVNGASNGASTNNMHVGKKSSETRPKNYAVAYHIKAK